MAARAEVDQGLQRINSAPTMLKPGRGDHGRDAGKIARHCLSFYRSDHGNFRPDQSAGLERGHRRAPRA
ncbi:hypothetical protein LP419_19655 [Massilia sp. H-1]|nr:hypothetical protein LP419_19655 [Massilia sp. H-1]